MFYSDLGCPIFFLFFYFWGVNIFFQQFFLSYCFRKLDLGMRIFSNKKTSFDITDFMENFFKNRIWLIYILWGCVFKRLVRKFCEEDFLIISVESTVRNYISLECGGDWERKLVNVKSKRFSWQTSKFWKNGSRNVGANENYVLFKFSRYFWINFSHINLHKF